MSQKRKKTLLQCLTWAAWTTKCYNSFMEERLIKIEANLDNVSNVAARVEKNIGDLTEIVVSMKEYMEENVVMKDELAEVVAKSGEKLGAKIEGVQRAVDAGFERDSTLEARITRVETELHI